MDTLKPVCGTHVVRKGDAAKEASGGFAKAPAKRRGLVRGVMNAVAREKARSGRDDSAGSGDGR